MILEWVFGTWTPPESFSPRQGLFVSFCYYYINTSVLGHLVLAISPAQRSSSSRRERVGVEVWVAHELLVQVVGCKSPDPLATVLLAEGKE